MDNNICPIFFPVFLFHYTQNQSYTRYNYYKIIMVHWWSVAVVLYIKVEKTLRSNYLSKKMSIKDQTTLIDEWILFGIKEKTRNQLING